VHFVGFIIRIYNDVWSSECQISCLSSCITWFVVDKGSLGHVFLQVFSFPISVTASVLHIFFHISSADAAHTSAIDSIIEYEHWCLFTITCLESEMIEPYLTAGTHRLPTQLMHLPTHYHQHHTLNHVWSARPLTMNWLRGTNIDAEVCLSGV
jgi:hypothetical protein